MSENDIHNQLESETWYELTRTAREFDEVIDQGDVEVEPFLLEMKEMVEQKLVSKADAICFVWDKAISKKEYCKKMADFFYEKAKTAENLEHFLKDKIKEAMVHMKRDEISANYFKLKISKTKPAVVVDESKLDPKYFTEKIVRTPNKEKILEDLLEGLWIEGASLSPSYSLRKSVQTIKNRLERIK